VTAETAPDDGIPAIIDWTHGDQFSHEFGDGALPASQQDKQHFSEAGPTTHGESVVPFTMPAAPQGGAKQPWFPEPATTPEGIEQLLNATLDGSATHLTDGYGGMPKKHTKARVPKTLPKKPPATHSGTPKGDSTVHPSTHKTMPEMPAVEDKSGRQAAHAEKVEKRKLKLTKKELGHHSHMLHQVRTKVQSDIKDAMKEDMTVRKHMRHVEREDARMEAHLAMERKKDKKAQAEIRAAKREKKRAQHMLRDAAHEQAAAARGITGSRKKQFDAAVREAARVDDEEDKERARWKMNMVHGKRQLKAKVRYLSAKLRHEKEKNADLNDQIVRVSDGASSQAKHTWSIVNAQGSKVKNLDSKLRHQLHRNAILDKVMKRKVRQALKAGKKKGARNWDALKSSLATNSVYENVQMIASMEAKLSRQANQTANEIVLTRSEARQKQLERTAKRLNRAAKESARKVKTYRKRHPHKGFWAHRHAGHIAKIGSKVKSQGHYERLLKSQNRYLKRHFQKNLKNQALHNYTMSKAEQEVADGVARTIHTGKAKTEDGVVATIHQTKKAKTENSTEKDRKDQKEGGLLLGASALKKTTLKESPAQKEQDLENGIEPDSRIGFMLMQKEAEDESNEEAADALLKRIHQEAEHDQAASDTAVESGVRAKRARMAKEKLHDIPMVAGAAERLSRKPVHRYLPVVTNDKGDVVTSMPPAPGFSMDSQRDESQRQFGETLSHNPGDESDMLKREDERREETAGAAMIRRIAQEDKEQARADALTAEKKVKAKAIAHKRHELERRQHKLTDQRVEKEVKQQFKKDAAEKRIKEKIKRAKETKEKVAERKAKVAERKEKRRLQNFDANEVASKEIQKAIDEKQEKKLAKKLNHAVHDSKPRTIYLHPRKEKKPTKVEPDLAKTKKWTHAIAKNLAKHAIAEVPAVHTQATPTAVGTHSEASWEEEP